MNKEHHRITLTLAKAVKFASENGYTRPYPKFKIRETGDGLIAWPVDGSAGWPADHISCPGCAKLYGAYNRKTCLACEECEKCCRCEEADRFMVGRDDALDWASYTM